jgi:hypothetical protein
VLATCDAEHDPKTLADWARLAGVSRSTLCETCCILDIRPHDSRDFARVLRTLIQGARQHCPPEALLDISDRRTLSTIRERAGMKTIVELRTCGVGSFLRSQTFVPSASPGVRRVADLLVSGGYVSRDALDEHQPGFGWKLEEGQLVSPSTSLSGRRNVEGTDQ